MHNIKLTSYLVTHGHLETATQEWQHSVHQAQKVEAQEDPNEATNVSKETIPSVNVKLLPDSNLD